ncbi:MAG: site-specific integrase [Cyclonatronaceae bacterium]
MKVHLRQRQYKSKGKISLYLELYKGTVKAPEGKTKALRDYEFLDLYLTAKPKNPAERQANKETLQLAESIRAKRELEIKNGEYGFKRSASPKADFMQFFKAEAKKREPKAGSLGNWLCAYNHLEAYAGASVPFKKIDKAFCEGFKKHLESVRISDNKPLASSSISSYFSKFSASLNLAVKQRILTYNPANEIEAPKVSYPKREYLTTDELKAAAKAECRYPVLKNAFLFSCLTGLRWSDVQKLTWSEVVKTDSGWRVDFSQKKTEKLQYLDIPDNALQYLGDRQADDERVFTGLKYSSYMNVALQRWMMEAGITKKITFHCARHTFAILQLQYGADIYTVSKLLGHSELKTTQIYADIIDSKRREAVNRLNQIDL